jgi:hypothetical protein
MIVVLSKVLLAKQLLFTLLQRETDELTLGFKTSQHNNSTDGAWFLEKTSTGVGRVGRFWLLTTRLVLSSQ